MDLLWYFIISIGLQVVMFVPALILKTDKFTDITYGATFVILALIGFFKSNQEVLHSIITILIVLWGIRLGVFLFRRIMQIKKDKRFDDIRNKPHKFLGFFLLQGVTAFIIMLPALFLYNTATTISVMSIVGIVLFVIALLIETIADYQKAMFRKKGTKGWIATGLWKYSRHPNYFGEILCWISMYLIVIASLPIEKVIISLLSPLFISFLLIFISGIPLLEKAADKKWGKKKAYQNYKKKTSVLIPWFPLK